MQVDTGQFRALTAAAAVNYDDGRDSFAYDLGTVICAMTDEGATDTEILDVTRLMIAARMQVGLPPEGWFVT